jgi:hypothetical protein
VGSNDGSNPNVPNPGSYGNPENVMDQDTGTDIFVLVRVLPIDLFGLTLTFS